VGFGLINYRWVFSAGRFLQSAVASGKSNPQPGGPVIRTLQLPLPDVPHAWNDASEPQRTMGKKLPRILPKVASFTSLLGSFTCRKFTTWRKECWGFFSLEKSDGFGRVWTRELGSQRPARLPLDYRSLFLTITSDINLAKKVEKWQYKWNKCVEEYCDLQSNTELP